MPERGGVRVELRGALDEGTTGVVANVAALVTGASAQDRAAFAEGWQERVAGLFA